ncbi:MAG: hypothetical protein CTR55_15455 [Pseudomonas sp.]|uniref:MarC family protein n=1 Tax=Pseudomonas sp. TaxID=306 RepID=UPI000CC41BE0|nr:MarC family protein [Pseudomonas sp.]PJI48153.1 MAG: hypothetical protein CTR55_15455 [Pseudomonas sp.]
MFHAYLLSLSGIAIIINPLTMFSIFTSYTQGLPSDDITRIGKKTTLAVAITLLICIWFGMELFRLLGITLASLQVAGGLSLLISCLQGLNDHSKSAPSPGSNIAVVPLCIPVIAGPAAISVVIKLTSETASPISVSLAALTVTAVLGSLFHFSVPVSKLLGEQAMSAIKQISYLVLACIGATLFITGVETMISQ